MCGIFGWVGKSPKKFNRAKFDILGLYNESRGVHSCGLSIDGDIKVGLDDVKLYKNFISKIETFPDPQHLPVVIGHTRQATYGKHTMENAHPFGFGESDYGFGFIGVHNGTLLNHEDLAKKYNVSETATTADKKVRTKIDSEILLEIIYKTKNFKVLSEYAGAAALVFYNVKEPNTVYCYHGKSKEYSIDKEAKEERPLYYYKETRNSLYISSMKNSLEAIAPDSSKIGEFEHNIVYKIVDGNVDKAVKFKISRENVLQKRSVFTDTSAYKTNSDYGFSKTRRFKRKTKSNKNASQRNKKELNIYNEPLRLSTKEIGDRPYFNGLRWLRNGHLINGIYTYLTEYGLYYLGHDLTGSNKAWENIKGKEFVFEEGLFTEYTENPETYVPFCVTQEKAPLQFFYKGIMLKSYQDYLQCLSREKEGRPFNWVQLSHASKHPVCQYVKNKPFREQNVMWNGVLYDGGYSMMGAFRNYMFDQGNLISIQDMDLPTNLYIKSKKEKPVIQLPMAFPDNLDNDELVTCCVGGEVEVGRNLEHREITETIDEVLVLDTIDKVFEGPLTTLPMAKQQLEKYLPSKTAKNAIELINTFCEMAMELT